MKSRSKPPDGWAEVTVGDAGEDLVDMKMFIEDGNLIVMIRADDGGFAASEDGGVTFRELVYADEAKETGRPVLWGMAVGMAVILFVQAIVLLVAVILEYG